ncbi:hypothetical protein KSD_78750 [Ktedonobacter sp. SOSP1-85]|nr:hypothetical protein KSD_78750 [Ktedonobacter sp. SOSP1-85]
MYANQHISTNGAVETILPPIRCVVKEGKQGQATSSFMSTGTTVPGQTAPHLEYRHTMVEITTRDLTMKDAFEQSHGFPSGMDLLEAQSRREANQKGVTFARCSLSSVRASERREESCKQATENPWRPTKQGGKECSSLANIPYHMVWYVEEKRV